MIREVDVLLVEDDPNDAELTIRALKKQGLANEIFHCIDGEDALNFIFCKGEYAENINKQKLKVILLDLKLPKISGLEVLKELKSNPSTSAIPVVVVSSSKEDPDIKTAYDLGVNSYIVKPVGFESFVKAIQNAGLYWLLINEPPLK